MRFPAAMRAQLLATAARLNIRPCHFVELAIADDIGWKDARTDAIRAHIAAMIGGEVRP